MDRRQRLLGDRIRQHQRRMTRTAFLLLTVVSAGVAASAADIPLGESKELLALAAYIGQQSRGMPIEIADDARMRPFLQAGQDMFTGRQGQLNLSCAQCHDDNWGQKLAGAAIPQGHPTGYPLYRLEWQTLGSLQRRLRNCLFGMRAVSYPYGAPEYVNLELYLMWRARRMPIETPAVRP